MGWTMLKKTALFLGGGFPEAYNMFGIHWEQSTSRWSRSAPASTSSSELWMGGRMKKMDDMKKIDEICNPEQRNDFPK